MLIVITLLLGRYAVQTGCHTRQFTLRAVVSFGVLLGLALCMLDFWTAWGQEQGAVEAAAWIREHGGGRVWYAGHWGFQYYAEHHGMEPVIPEYGEVDGLPGTTLFRRGDWLVLPDDKISQQKFQLDPEDVHEVTRITLDDPIPLRTLSTFYGWTVAVQHREGPRVQLRIFQVEREFWAKSPPPP
jgi:hypothetical protein